MGCRIAERGGQRSVSAFSREIVNSIGQNKFTYVREFEKPMNVATVQVSTRLLFIFFPCISLTCKGAQRKSPRDRLAVTHRHVIASIVQALSICQIFQKNIRLSVIYQLFENLDRPPVKLLERTINEEHNKITVFDKTWLHSNLNSRNHQKILYAILLLRFCAHFMYLLGS